MRALLFLGLLTAATAAAQSRPPLSPDQEAALYGIPAVTTFGAALVIVKSEESALTTGAFLALPLLAVGTTCAAGRFTGVPGSCRGAFQGMLKGALPGFVLVAGGLALQEGSGSALDGNALALLLAGGIAYVVVPPFAAIAGYRRGATVEVAPVLLAVPEAEALGMQVRVGL